jgi:hypothetical protein
MAIAEDVAVTPGQVSDPMWLAPDWFRGLRLEYCRLRLQKRRTKAPFLHSRVWLGGWAENRGCFYLLLLI